MGKMTVRIYVKYCTITDWYNIIIAGFYEGFYHNFWDFMGFFNTSESGKM